MLSNKKIFFKTSEALFVNQRKLFYPTNHDLCQIYVDLFFSKMSPTFFFSDKDYLIVSRWI